MKLKKHQLRNIRIQVVANKEQYKQIKKTAKSYKKSMSSYLLMAHELFPKESDNSLIK